MIWLIREAGQRFRWHKRFNILAIASKCVGFMHVLSNCEKNLSASSSVSICPSVRRKQIDSRWTYFRDNLHSGVLLKFVDKIIFWLKWDKSNGRLIWRHKCLHFGGGGISHCFLLHWWQYSVVAFGAEAMVIPFIKSTDKVSKRASNVTVCINYSCSIQYSTYTRICNFPASYIGPDREHWKIWHLIHTFANICLSTDIHTQIYMVYMCTQGKFVRA